MPEYQGLYDKETERQRCYTFARDKTPFSHSLGFFDLPTMDYAAAQPMALRHNRVVDFFVQLSSSCSKVRCFILFSFL